jgi:putative hydrolase of the HAD superfamily
MGGMIADMTQTPLSVADWAAIDHVLLDLDGTLLDLHYDRHFWFEVVPGAWGKPRGLGVEAARLQLQPRFRACEGTLDWYCIDYWSRELELDIIALKRADTTRIGWLPGAREFVRRLRKLGKRTVLATNSHPVVLAIKDQQTQVRRELDASFSSHGFGVPKEHPGFWRGLADVERFDPARTLFVDDSLPVLRAARMAGVAHLIAVRRPDSQSPPRHNDEFTSVDSVAELLTSDIARLR